MAKRKAPEKIERVTHDQYLALWKHFKENEGAYRGTSYQDVSKVVSEVMGFPVPIATLQQLSKKQGFKFGIEKVSRGRANKSIDADLKRLAEYVIYLAESGNLAVPDDIRQICY